jgi:hypothetical protein
MSLIDNETGQHPVFMGPSMIHLKKDFETYLKFAKEIKAFDLTNLNQLDFKIIVTDDDVALHKAFKTVFPKSKFMLCLNHLRKDISKKLNQYRVPEEKKSEIINLIFGSDKNRDTSLIGSKNTTEYEARMNYLLDECNHKHPFLKHSFEEYIKDHKIKKIYNNFCKIKWRFESIVTDYITTNDIEGKKIICFVLITL